MVSRVGAGVRLGGGFAADFLASNPQNRLERAPLAFFSTANPDGYDHMRAVVQFNGGVTLPWEDPLHVSAEQRFDLELVRAGAHAACVAADAPISRAPFLLPTGGCGGAIADCSCPTSRSREQEERLLTLAQVAQKIQCSVPS